MQLVQSRLRLTLVVALAGASATVLAATPPNLAVASLSRGDDLALSAAWAVALAASVWLFAVSAACLLAIGARRPRLASALARALPPALRRAVDVAVIASCLAVSAAPAHAVNRGPGAVIDQPIVRAPRSLAVTPTTRFGRPSPTSPITPRVPAPRSTAAPPTVAPRRPTPTTTAPLRAAPRPADGGDHSSLLDPTPTPTPPAPRAVLPAPHVVVRPGDNLWVIARAELIRSTGAYPNDAQVARYWSAVIDANRGTLRSGSPGLIFPGEIVALPPVPPLS